MTVRLAQTTEKIHYRAARLPTGGEANGVGHTPTDDGQLRSRRQPTPQEEKIMANPNNNGNIIGRLADKPKSFDNADGSKKIYLTLFAERNFKNREGSRDSDAIALEAFVPGTVKGLGVYDLMGRGDLVAVSYELRAEKYSKDGQVIYKQYCRVEDVQLLEPKSVTQQRRANEASKQAPAPQAEAAPAEAVDDVAELERRLAALKAAKAAQADGDASGGDASESPFGN